MAIPDNYIDKITKDGESRMISPAADKVRVNNEHYEGDNLDDVLDEITEAIGDAGSGDGTVKGVKVGSTTYEPDSETGVVDLSTPIAGKVDKVPGKGLSTNDYTDAEKTKLQNLPTADGLTQQLNSKANDNAVVKSISVNGTAQSKDTNGNVNIEGSGGSQVTVTTNNDGTFTIHAGDNDYTINLNHTHEGMAKLVVDSAANLPDVEDMEEDTIYGEVEDGEISVLYVGGIPFYGGGGGGASSGPVLREPSDGAVIQMGQVEGGSVTNTIKIKGRWLTQDLTVELDGTGYSFAQTQPTGVTIDQQAQLPTVTVDAEAANSLSGVLVAVVYTGSDFNAQATLAITSGTPDNISCEVTLNANVPSYVDLAAVKFTGTQWLLTDYYPNALTEFEMEVKFTANSHSEEVNDSIGRVILGCLANSNPTKYFSFYNLKPTSSKINNAYGFEFLNEDDQSGQAMAYGIEITSKAMFTADHTLIKYNRGSSHYVYLLDSGGTGTSVATKRLQKKTSAMTNPLTICGSPSAQYARFDLTVYRFTIKENGVNVRNYVPKSFGSVAGLYDTVNDTFISSETAKVSGLASDELVAIHITSNE